MLAESLRKVKNITQKKENDLMLLWIKSCGAILDDCMKKILKFDFRKIT